MPILIRGGLVLVTPDADPSTQDILVEGDRVAAVGPSLTPGPDATVLDAANQLVIPGLVNAHVHTHNNLARSAADGLPLELWLGELAARVVGRTPREVYVGAALGALEMLRSGTTTACDMASILPWPTDEALDAVARAYADVGLRANIAPQVADRPFWHALAGLEALLPPDAIAEVTRRPAMPLGELLSMLGRFVDRWHGAADGRIQVGLGPTLATVCSRELLEGCAELAAARELAIQTHLSESKAEAVTARAQYHTSFTAHLAELGLLGPRTVLAHAVWVDDAELDLVAASGSIVAHNPVSNLKLGSGLAPLTAMLARGIPLALGTDGAASNDSLSLFGPLKLAALLPRAADSDYDRWPRAADLLRMATTGGARAAGLANQLGEIRPGQLADLALLDLDAPHWHPRNALRDQLVYAESGASVRTVLVGGRLVLHDRRATTVDEPALLAEADEIGRAIAATLDRTAAFARRIQPHVRRAHLAATRADWPVNRFAKDRYRDLPDT